MFALGPICVSSRIAIHATSAQTPALTAMNVSVSYMPCGQGLDPWVQTLVPYASSIARGMARLRECPTGDDATTASWRSLIAVSSASDSMWTFALSVS